MLRYSELLSTININSKIPLSVDSFIELQSCASKIRSIRSIRLAMSLSKDSVSNYMQRDRVAFQILWIAERWISILFDPINNFEVLYGIYWLFNEAREQDTPKDTRRINLTMCYTRTRTKKEPTMLEHNWIEFPFLYNEKKSY